MQVKAKVLIPAIKHKVNFNGDLKIGNLWHFLKPWETHTHTHTYKLKRDAQTHTYSYESTQTHKQMHILYLNPHKHPHYHTHITSQRKDVSKSFTSS